MKIETIFSHQTYQNLVRNGRQEDEVFEGRKQRDAVACSRQSQELRYDCENFAGIAKISQL